MTGGLGESYFCALLLVITEFLRSLYELFPLYGRHPQNGTCFQMTHNNVLTIFFYSCGEREYVLEVRLSY